MFSKATAFNRVTRSGPKVLWTLLNTLLFYCLLAFAFVLNRVEHFTGICKWVCGDRKWCRARKSFGIPSWSRVPYWNRKEQVYWGFLWVFLLNYAQLYVLDDQTKVFQFLSLGGTPMQLYSTLFRSTVLLATGCSYFSQSQMEQHFWIHHFKQLVQIH
jgi:hypothetical protein